MTEKSEDKGVVQDTEEAPQVYAVQKDLAGWRFDRRGLLAAAGAALAGAASGCSVSTPEPTSTPVPTATPWPTLSPGEVSDERARMEACQGIRAHLSGVRALALSSDGELLISGDRTVKLWSLPSGTLVKTLELEGDSDSASALAVSPDGTLMASGGYDGIISLWSLPEGALVKKLEGHKDSHVAALAVTPDGKLLASGGGDPAIRLWSLPEGVLIKTLDSERYSESLVVSPDGTLLIAARLWSLPEGELVEPVVSIGRFAAVSPDGTFVASGGHDATVALNSLPDGERIQTLKPSTTSVVTALAISPDGTLLASGSVDGTITLWSLPEGALARTLEGHIPGVNALVFSVDGTLLASGSTDGTIKLWSLPAGGVFASCLMDLAANDSDIEGVTYRLESESGELLEYTLPCGSPIPAGAVCVCNCVAGSYVPPCSCVGHSGGGHYWYPC